MKNFHLHLVSDSTGNTLRHLSRAVVVQFHGIKATEHMWPMIRTIGQIDNVIKAIQKNPGVVMYTIVGKELRDKLKNCCKSLQIPCVPVLSRALDDISKYLGIEAKPTIAGKQYDMDQDYFDRIQAMNFTIAHDDGLNSKSLKDAQIILVGVSRTSKSPTCFYLAHRGYRSANVPFVLNHELPENLFKINNSLIVGLTIDPRRLIEIRKSRILAFSDSHKISYAEEEIVMEEINQAKKLFLRHNWPIIDVTRKSVEEVVATIISYYNQRNL